MMPLQKVIATIAGLAVISGASVLWWIHSKEVSDAKRLSATTAETRAQAEAGDRLAEFALARMYYTGTGVPQDYAAAARWYRKSAEQGYAHAQFDLGDLYFRGKGVPQDNTQALLWIRKAADQGDVKAESALGYMYLYGVGLQRDYTEAAQWYKKSADGGEITAETALGRMYATGQGVPTDRAAALRWYGKAAAHGDPEAKRAVRVLEGRSVPGAPAQWPELVVALIAIPAGLWASFEFLLPGRSIRNPRQILITLLGISFLCSGALSVYAFLHNGICYLPHPEAFRVGRFLFTAFAFLLLVTLLFPTKRESGRWNTASRNSTDNR